MPICSTLFCLEQQPAIDLHVWWGHGLDGIESHSSWALLTILTCLLPARVPALPNSMPEAPSAVLAYPAFSLEGYSHTFHETSIPLPLTVTSLKPPLTSLETAAHAHTHKISCGHKRFPFLSWGKCFIVLLLRRVFSVRLGQPQGGSTFPAFLLETRQNARSMGGFKRGICREAGALGTFAASAPPTDRMVVTEEVARVCEGSWDSTRWGFTGPAAGRGSRGMPHRLLKVNWTVPDWTSVPPPPFWKLDRNLWVGVSQPPLSTKTGLSVSLDQCWAFLLRDAVYKGYLQVFN